MRLLLISLNIFLINHLFAQIKPSIYFFPGQGSDKQLFDSLVFDEPYKTVMIEYGTPEKEMNLHTFAKSLVNQIDTTEAFVLIGVSFGGMICVELSELLKPQKTIIISSAKNRTELPFRYKFQKVIPIYKLFPGSVLLGGAKLLQPIIEPDRNKNKTTFKSMLHHKNAMYMKRTIHLLINWERKQNNTAIYHIHGSKDHTLPIKKIKNPSHIIKKGSHMMTLTKAKEISVILNSILKE